MTYPADYRALAVPRLQHAARLAAIAVVTEATTFGDAMLELLALAYRLGAGRLGDDIRLDLHDAIAAWLLAAVEAVLPAWDEAQGRAARVAADIIRFEAEIARKATP